jgi:HK97 family phage major capsid protein
MDKLVVESESEPEPEEPESEGEQSDQGVDFVPEDDDSGSDDDAKAARAKKKKAAKANAKAAKKKASKSKKKRKSKSPSAKRAKKAKDAENQKTLYEVMGFMRDVRKRQDRTDEMFEPLLATVSLLKTYGVTVTEDVLRQLEEAPLAWSGMKKKVLNVREKLSLMQQSEARKIRETSDSFGVKVEKFREHFLALAPVTGK